MTVEINVNFAGLGQYAWDNWSDRAGPALEAAAKDEAPVDEGTLRDSIEYRKTGGLTGELRASADHAAVVITGHGEITPKNPDGVLSWLSKMSGERVYAKRVSAVAANNFLARAARRLGLRV